MDFQSISTREIGVFVNRSFKYISYLAIPFVLAGVVYFFMIASKDVIYLDDIGYAMFFIGIGVSLESLDDDKNFVAIEKFLFKKRRMFKVLLTFHFATSILLLIFGVALFNISIFNKTIEPSLLSGFKNLALGIFSLAIGFISSYKYSVGRFEAFHEN